MSTIFSKRCSAPRGCSLFSAFLHFLREAYPKWIYISRLPPKHTPVFPDISWFNSMLGLYLGMISTHWERFSTEPQDADIGWPILLTVSSRSSVFDFARFESRPFPLEEP
jgi:hypothetical protein